jgi:PPE-repeat protein
MAIDFSLVPPDTTSTLIYTGPGVVPLMAAAAAYANLAAEVSTTATQWESVITSLTTQQWTGTGAAAAATAAQPIVNYLTNTATTLEQAAAQATASAAAYETTFAAVVPPPVVYANITEHAALVAANPAALGLLTPLILANEAEYAAFWAQDATAMATYQAASLTAGTLTPVTPLASGRSHPGLQSLATTNAVAQAPITQALAAIPVQNTSLLGSIDSALGTPSIFNSINGAVNTAAWFVGNTIPTAVSLGHTLAGATVPALAVGDVVPDGSAAGVVEGTMVRSVTPMGGMGFGGSAMAGMGESSLVGKLAVPATWSAAAPAAELASATAPLGGSGWTVAAEEAGAGGMGAPGMPGMVGGAGAKGAGAFAGPRYGTKPIVMPKSVVV